VPAFQGQTKLGAAHDRGRSGGSDSGSVSGARTGDALPGIACLAFCAACVTSVGRSSRSRSVRSGVELSCAKADESGAGTEAEGPAFHGATHGLASLRATPSEKLTLARRSFGWLRVQAARPSCPPCAWRGLVAGSGAARCPFAKCAGCRGPSRTGFTSKPSGELVGRGLQGDLHRSSTRTEPLLRAGARREAR